MTAALSPREREIVGLVCEGWTSREIAGQLGIVQRTVEAHRQTAMRKLHARCVGQLVRRAYRAKLWRPT